MMTEAIENAKQVVKKHTPDILTGYGCISIFAAMKEFVDDLGEEQKQRIRDIIEKQEERAQ